MESFRAQYANIKIDRRSFELGLEYAIKQGEQSVLVDHLIRLGASQAMLEELASLDSDNYHIRCRALNVAPTSSGRPPMLTQDEEMLLLRAQRRQPHDIETDPLHWYYFMGMETGIQLKKLWAHMNRTGITNED